LAACSRSLAALRAIVELLVAPEELDQDADRIARSGGTVLASSAPRRASELADMSLDCASSRPGATEAAAL
jgi:hypothetical protein